MYLLRRNSAALLAAFAFVLGACSSESTPTEPQVPTTGDIGEDPLRITINPGILVFEGSGPATPAPQMLGVGGLVAIGSGVQFGDFSYNDAVAPWAYVDPRPTFNRDPLEWRHMVGINAAAYGALPTGAYSARLPVRVTAARNSPQYLDVFLCKNTGCLAVDDSDTGELSGADATWNRGNDPGAPGAYEYDDYILFIPAGATAHIRMLGASCDAYTLSDPYLYLFDLANNLLSSNDDSWCGLSAYLVYTNLTAQQQAYRLRATNFGDSQLGTYEIVVSSTAPASLRDEAAQAADVAAKAAKAAGAR